MSPSAPRSGTSPAHTRLAGFGVLRAGLAALAAALGLYLLLLPLSAFTPLENRTAALVVVAIGFWATGVLPEHLTALWFFLLAMILAVAPPALVFSGFASAAFWLVFAGLVLGVAVEETGLGARIANRVAERLTGSHLALIAGMVAIGVAFGFLMPSSMGRVVLLVPIALAIADHAGFTVGSKGRTAVVLAAAFGAYMPTFAILPANVPNMVLVGTAENLYGISPLYGEYLLLHFPVLGLLKAVAIVLLIAWLYPDRPMPDRHTVPVREPLSAAERKLAWVLLTALALWLTDFLHHVSPAWVALAAALILLLPRFGIVGARQFKEGVHYNSLLFVAGVMGLGAVVAHSGLGAHLAQALGAWLPLRKGSAFVDFASLTATSLVTAVFTTPAGAPAVLTPLAGKMAQVSGLSLKTVLMTQVPGISMPLFPYQSAPLVVGMQIAGEGLVPAARLCLALAVVTILLLLPLDYLWWRWLGWL